MTRSDTKITDTLMLFVRATRTQGYRKSATLSDAADPFFEIENSSHQVVARSELLRHDANPIWPPLRLDMDALCEGDSSKEITISWYDFHKDLQHECIGSIRTSVSDLQRAAKDYQSQNKGKSILDIKEFCRFADTRIYIYDAIMREGPAASDSTVQGSKRALADDDEITEPETESSYQDSDPAIASSDVSVTRSAASTAPSATSVPQSVAMTQSPASHAVVSDNGGSVPPPSDGSVAGPASVSSSSAPRRSDGDASVASHTSAAARSTASQPAGLFPSGASKAGASVVSTSDATIPVANGDAKPREKTKCEPIVEEPTSPRTPMSKSLFRGVIGKGASLFSGVIGGKAMDSRQLEAVTEAEVDEDEKPNSFVVESVDLPLRDCEQEMHVEALQRGAEMAQLDCDESVLLNGERAMPEPSAFDAYDYDGLVSAWSDDDDNEHQEVASSSLLLSEPPTGSANNIPHGDGTSVASESVHELMGQIDDLLGDMLKAPTAKQEVDDNNDLQKPKSKVAHFMARSGRKKKSNKDMSDVDAAASPVRSAVGLESPPRLFGSSASVNLMMPVSKLKAQRIRMFDGGGSVKSTP